ncbi:wall-associated receptor kinase 3-like [Lolium rigidum]|uniref:wall-associated receptor kinase 3-like n=1 Tax=Lolium rigidum TaxID=89674 RepID=UPI001F5CED59|nr:wall-associated receptor kinase 3-like [Lolium rigidum]
MKIPSQLLMPLLLLAVAAPAAQLILPAIAEQRGLEAQLQPIAHPGCQDKCGEMSIPFPFGMGKPGSGCFLPGFEVYCPSSYHPPRAFLRYNVSGPLHLMSIGKHRFNVAGTVSADSYEWVELMDISVADNEARVYRVVSSDCSTNSTHFTAKLQYTRLGDEGPFLLSATRNVLIGVGSNVESYMVSYLGEAENETKAYMPSCLSNLMGNLEYATNGTCSGLGCCLADLPKKTDPFSRFGVSFMPRQNFLWETTPCFYGMLVDKSWYNFSTLDLNGLGALYPRGVPIVLDFAVRNLGSCPAEGQEPPPGYACVSGNSTCANTSGGAYVCKCLQHYDGNPYIAGRGGCTDIDECALPDSYNCSPDGICSNRLEGYDCPCKPGMKGDGKKGHCAEIFPLAAKVVVGFAALIVVLVLMVMARQLLKLKRFYEQNGGPVLKSVKNIRIYRRKQMKQITNNYNRIIGEGHFGKVYFGTLENKQPVAIKRSIKVDKEMKAEFTGEVIIQSEMRHKNIARLLGCCLEMDVPMLMYEYASTGSLYDILFGSRRINVIPVGIRLGIAAGSAEGLTYMHSGTNAS